MEAKEGRRREESMAERKDAKIDKEKDRSKEKERDRERSFQVPPLVGSQSNGTYGYAEKIREREKEQISSVHRGMVCMGSISFSSSIALDLRIMVL